MTRFEFVLRLAQHVEFLKSIGLDLDDVFFYHVIKYAQNHGYKVTKYDVDFWMNIE